MFGKLRRLVIFLLLADAVGTQIALLLANAARLGLPLGRALGPVDSFLNPALQGIVAVVWVAVFLTLSVYDVRRERWPVGSARALLAAVSVAVFVFAGVLYFSFRDTPRLLVGYFFVIDLALLSGIRLVAGAVVRYRRERGQPLGRVLIVGTGETAKAAARVLSRRATGIEIVGCVGGEDAAGVRVGQADPASRPSCRVRRQIFPAAAASPATRGDPARPSRVRRTRSWPLASSSATRRASSSEGGVPP